MYRTKDDNGIEYDCAYCGAITKYDSEDNTWICTNSECWASKEPIKCDLKEDYK